ncbi:DNA polymerase III beta subunit [hydrothermal vent metagenome]|uniref:DNA polymerase III beta subunit n=1 Tax=hydrothermal vent metagenome TaxID=652676 RepID=A0A3B0URZ7_9ZZZZ
MKVTLERNHLLKSLGHVHRVVERRNTYPVLANVLLRADENGLELRTTDLDIQVTETVPAEVAENGATTVPAHTLYEIVRKLADGAQVHLETEGDQNMAITSSRSKFFLSCLSADGFPDLKSGDFPHSFTVAAPELAGLIERTQFAISNEETRYYLNGIYFHHIEEDGKNLLRAAATDGHRLARTDIEAPDGIAGMAGIIVPRKTVTEMAKLLDGVEDEVFVELSDSKIRLKVARVVLLSKLIEGTFPDYERVMPKDNDKRMAVDRISFAAAVDRVSTIASERGGKVVKLSLSAGMLELSVTNPDHGNASEELPVDYDDADFEIGFNARYLLDIISQIKSDNAVFMFGDQGSPTLVSDENQANAVYVLMPMRV